MLAKPKLEFDLNKIYENALKMKAECDKHHLLPNFATKGFCAAPEIIKVLQKAGIDRFCDSRMLNIMNIKKQIPDAWVMLIRTPAPTEAPEVVEWADASIHSEALTVKEISEAAVNTGKIHDIYLDIDVGDIRDGLFGNDQIDRFMDEIKDLPGINVIGVLANVGCTGSVLPDENNTGMLVDIKDRINEKYQMDIKYVSFGGTVAYQMITEGRMPEGVNEFRFAEAVLFGEDTTGCRYIDGFHRDAVVFCAPVVEKKRKPSVPIGQLGHDASGNTGIYIDRGIRTRIICAAGKQDVAPDALKLNDPGMIYIAASSDHIIVDVEDSDHRPEIGDYLDFRCGYMAMMTACTSPYVEKVYLPCDIISEQIS